MSERRVAIVLFNLGGPDSLDAVRPFLFNLFNDGAIIGAPQPLRWALAQFISRAREKTAQENYALMGGRSPLLPETEAQAEALRAALKTRSLECETEVFVAMRYWRPFVADAARAVDAWGATEVLLLPLYPQFSTTTTGSSLAAWQRVSGLPARTFCCYPSQPDVAKAHAEAILAAWRSGGSPEPVRVLFSAHGLPQSVVDRGDPYQWQVERSVRAVQAMLPPEWEHRISYQSRVGPMKWLGPSTLEEIDAAGRSKIGLIVSPIAFVSEHIETLVELDIEYAQHAAAIGVPFYLRAPALSAAPRFIAALADLAEQAIRAPSRAFRSEAEGRICPAAFGMCPQKACA